MNPDYFTMEILLENFKNSIEKQFIIDSDSCPISTRKERSIVHDLCNKMGLFTKSSGSGDQKIITVYKEQSMILFEITDDDRTSFIRDYRLPIVINFEPYFSYFVKLYDSIYSTDQKYALLVDAVDQLNKIRKSLQSYAHELSDQIGSELIKVPAYKDFASSTKYNVKEFPNSKNIYAVKCNTELVYISLDIRTANFTALKFVDPELVLNCQTWDQLIRKFTSIEYFIQSKYFRQITFGKIGPIMKRVSSIQKYLTNEFYNKIKNGVNVEGASNDEIIISSTTETLETDLNFIRNALIEMPVHMQNIWKIIPFTLVSIGNSKSFVKKNLNDDTIEIKNTDKDFYAQALKYYLGQKLEPLDMKGMKNGFIITYDEKYIC